MLAAPLLAEEPARLGLAEPHLATLPRTAEDSRRVTEVTAPTRDFTRAEPFEENPGGGTTVAARNDRDAFSLPAANLSFEQGLEFHLGEALFDKLWVFAPSSTRASDGLGPVYNARACQRCHIRDGRGHLPDGPGYSSASTFLRISIPGPIPAKMAPVSDYIGSAPDPVYGSQLQDFSAPNVAPEYRLHVSYTEEEVTLNGGERVTLRKPEFTAAELKYGPLHEGAMLSPRVAPPMIGLGLLEAIPAADILALADAEDANGDGISGRANLVWARDFQQIMLGRFGLKAGKATIHDQSAAAFNGDIGISTPLYPEPWGDCTEAQTDCRSAPHGDQDERGTELDQPNMDLVTFYSRNIAVPARRDVDAPDVLRGKAVFYDAGCPLCHRPKFVTHRLSDRAEQSFQLIWPYS
ncbi:di-heme oxidoredictase family protein, partial [Phaeobacter sp. HF9A]|uniref:di-heme oxidoreductase family protein n=1 Tax=Phaeobacter sp. HF9A TaxID=2721561 RepID=UPI0034C6B821